MSHHQWTYHLLDHVAYQKKRDKNSALWPALNLQFADQHTLLINEPLYSDESSDTHARLMYDSVQEDQGIQLANFRIQIDYQQQQLFIYGDHSKKFIFTSVAHKAFLLVRYDQAKVHESRGFFKMKEKIGAFYKSQQEIIGWSYQDDLQVERSKHAPLDQALHQDQLDDISSTPYIKLWGNFLENHQIIAQWSMYLFAFEDRLHIISLLNDQEQLQKDARLCLRFHQNSEQSIYGLGTQYTWVDLQGKVVPILSQEPGIGRGIQPLTFLLEKGFSAGGSDVQSNAPAPYMLSSDGTCLYLNHYEYSVFDFSYTEQIRIELWATYTHLTLIDQATPLQQIQAYTEYAGRMRPLPKWSQEGAIIGMQGGSKVVRNMWQELRTAGVPIAAFWLQDWVGRRKTSVGEQLWWNWEVDHERYPDWPILCADLKAAGIRVLGYINPFLVDATQRSKKSQGGIVHRDLYREALDQKLVIYKDQKPYRIMNTSFSALLLDLTSSQTRAWIKEVIQTQMIAQGFSGWMADFGEALPFDADLNQGIASQFHNQYPEIWAKINQEAICELGQEDEIFFFTRSGFTRTPRYSSLSWLGDQLTSWKHQDGIKSAVTGLLSSGISGVSLNHSDIGGYTTTNPPWLKPLVPGIGYRRTQELMLRWIELNAFTAVFRTHEGNQPQRNHQINSDPLTLQHFSFFAQIYAALADYRNQLMQEASEKGYPLVRHLWLENPQDSHTQLIDDQWLLGSEILVAPILHAQTDQREFYLPSGRWIHIWSQIVIDTQEAHDSSYGMWMTMKAPIAYPLVFIRQRDSNHFDLITKILQVKRPTGLEDIDLKSIR